MYELRYVRVSNGNCDIAISYIRYEVKCIYDGKVSVEVSFVCVKRNKCENFYTKQVKVDKL